MGSAQPIALAGALYSSYTTVTVYINAMELQVITNNFNVISIVLVDLDAYYQWKNV